MSHSKEVKNLCVHTCVTLGEECFTISSMKFYDVSQELGWQEEERFIRIIAPVILFNSLNHLRKFQITSKP